ncbi:ExeM/NucH family extracellular endonuclease [Nesterenkonia alba]|uniref:ExeM/NucH family extracellular endonuclease n=1 Tax=Nesterenkonia alba TaxID=515814 RepID=UPI0003B58FA3|nr:ExeM/NucH family extracellular endonuclease [Nesterenkonia alba]
MAITNEARLTRPPTRLLANRLLKGLGTAALTVGLLGVTPSAMATEADETPTDAPTATQQSTEAAEEPTEDTGSDDAEDTGDSTQDPPAEELSIPEIHTLLEDHEDTGDTAVTTRGVVTAVYPDEESFGGFYLQTEGTGGDLSIDEHTTSEAIFVYSPSSVEEDDADVVIGDYVELTGDATVYAANGQPQISLFPGSEETEHHELSVLDDDHEPVTPAQVTFPETPEARDSLLGMLIEPQGSYTVTDHYTLNQFGEIGLVLGDEPLYNPTSVVEPGEPARALAEENRQRLFYLDDGATTNFTQSPGNQSQLPYITAEDPVRVGAEAEFHQPVIVHYDFGEYRLQPVAPLQGPEDEHTPASFENTRPPHQTPAERTGDLRIAGFNVLNYFVHLGEDEPGCEYFADRDGNPTTTDWCDVRGAYSQESFERQQAKIVAAINEMDADVVALQEMENSGHFHPEADRDYAHARLVEALNEDLGYQAWDYVAEPEDVPALEDEDVIRNGYIYKPEAVEVVDSWILFDEGVEELPTAAFEDLDRELADIYSNAREPYAVEFQPVEGTEQDRFIAVVNHFKSKSDGEMADVDPAADPNADQNDGQSAWNADRIDQARGVQAFAEALVEHTGTENVHLMGDFNSYEFEDPLQVFFEQGYTNLSAETGQHSYMFDAEVGSLDHLISSPSAAETVTHTEIWQINAVEPIALEYSRYNGNASDLFRTDQWRSSDHDPIVADIVLTGDQDTQTPSPESTETEDPGSPTSDPSPTPTGAPEDTEDPAAGDQPEASDDRRDLARTGATVGVVALGAFVLLAMGAALLRLTRRELDLFD